MDRLFRSPCRLPHLSQLSLSHKAQSKDPLDFVEQRPIITARCICHVESRFVPSSEVGNTRALRNLSEFCHLPPGRAARALGPMFRSSVARYEHFSAGTADRETEKRN
jgi:hypothetical protein